VDALESNGKKTISELAVLLEVPRDTIDRTLQRYDGTKVEKVTTTKPFVWGLSA